MDAMKEHRVRGGRGDRSRLPVAAAVLIVAAVGASAVCASTRLAATGRIVFVTNRVHNLYRTDLKAVSDDGRGERVLPFELAGRSRLAHAPRPRPARGLRLVDVAAPRARPLEMSGLGWIRRSELESPPLCQHRVSNFRRNEANPVHR